MISAVVATCAFLEVSDVSVQCISDQKSEQSWLEVYRRCIFDQKPWAKTPWSEVYKNGVSNQNSLSVMNISIAKHNRNHQCGKIV